MVDYGLTADGFNRKRQADIKIDLENALKLAFGENIDLTAESGFGQFVGIISESLADQWENLENVYNSQYPSTASGVQLSNVVLLNDIERIEAEKSTVTVTATGTSGIIIPSGSQISTSDTGDVFVTLADGTIGGGGTVDIDCESQEYGPIEASIGTLTVIDTPIFGWTSVTNAAAAVAGRYEETDAELRIRQAASTFTNGQNMEESLYAQLLNLDDVIDALVYSNRTNSTDGYGIPAHEFLTVVEGGDDNEIADLIWINTPQGIQSYGTTNVTIEDSQGFDQEIYFTRPSDVNIYFEVNITTGDDYPVDGADQIKAAMVSYGESTFKINDTVIMSKFYGAINSVVGVESITLYMGTSPSPATTANITIDIDEIATFDDTFIDVNVI